MRHFVFFIFVAIVSFALFLATYLGAFKEVEVTRQQRPEFVTIAKKFMGPYHKTVSAIEAVEKWAAENKVDCRLSFGQYLDDPKTVEEARLRSLGGCVVQENLEKIPATLPDGFEKRSIVAGEYIVAFFAGSPGIGPLKVYLRVHEYAQEQTLTLDTQVFEIYEILDRNAKSAMTTTYLFPLKP